MMKKSEQVHLNKSSKCRNEVQVYRIIYYVISQMWNVNQHMLNDSEKLLFIVFYSIIGS